MNKKIFLQQIAACSVMLAALWAMPATAASTDIANVPMTVKSVVKPNIMFTLDDSGSMDWPFMPDSAFNNRSNNCFKNNLFNQMYYSPNITYTPGMSDTGTSLGDSNFNAAPYNAYEAGALYSTLQYGGSSYRSAAVDLATSFQAYNDNSRYNLCSYGGCESPRPAYYYKYTGPGTPVANTCYSNSSYTKVVVSATSGPNNTDERQNFANWFTYYRTRMQTMKTGLGLAFSTLDNKFRVGFSVINGDNFSDIQDFDASQKSSWYQQLYASVPGGGTPLREMLANVGEYFRTGVMTPTGGRPAVTNQDPVQYACQQNFEVLSTDGYWNDSFSLPSPTNWDRNVLMLPEPVAGLTVGNSWPAPYREGTTATGSTLADVAMKYWNTDLRPGWAHNVPTNPADPATWQHMVTYTIGLGVNGTLAYPADAAALKDGTKNWPTPAPDSPSAVDDLWHAAVNGHGAYLSAKDPVSLRSSLNAVINDIIGRTGAAASLAVSNANVKPGDNFAYASSYNSGSWTGDLQAYPIDLVTGLPNDNSPIWTPSTQAQLDAQAWTSRKIATYSGSAGIPFQWASLAGTQQARMNTAISPPGTADGAAVINYLRGSRAGEGALYRARKHVLGDIINSEPIVVREPTAYFSDNGYTAFKSAQSSRAKTIYQGANDGMLHAIDAATGAEKWAYVPGLLYRMSMPGDASTSSLVNLSMLNGFSHLYYVDGTPNVADVDFNPTSPDWHTVLVGGLRKGGRGYYALDVTNPAAASEADVAAKVLWEFPNAATPASVAQNVGYSFGKALIVKTKAAGWVAIVSSGYNNGTNSGDSGGDGQGHLYILNIADGTLISDIPTGAGSSTSPSGLGPIGAFVTNAGVSNVVQYVYGGDLLGNAWRFDLTGSTVSSWNVARLATLVDAANTPQPITAVPKFATVNGKRVVYFGTGQYLGDTDVPGSPGANPNATQTQTMYGLLDDQSTAPLISPLRSNLVRQALTTVGSIRTSTNNPVDFSVKKGWYVDYPLAGERSVTDPSLALGELTFTTNVPQFSPCQPGGSSWLYVLDYRNGGAIPNASWASVLIGNTLASRAVLVRLSNGTIKALIRKSDATNSSITVPPPPPGSSRARVTWREVVSP